MTTEPVRRPSRVVAVAATQRTGSFLLCAGLSAAGLADRPLHHWEVLQSWQVFHRQLAKPWHVRIRLHVGRLWRWCAPGEAWRRRTRTTVGARRAYLDFLAARFTTGDGMLGVKMMWPQYEEALLRDGLDMTYWGVPVTWIHLWRRDEVRQAVSLARGEQTGRWLEGLHGGRHGGRRRRDGETRYDVALIERCLERVRNGKKGWETHFAEQGIDPIEVVYEDLDADYEGTMRRVLDAVGMSDVPVPQRQIERQSDGMNDEWVERFLRDRPDCVAAR